SPPHHTLRTSDTHPRLSAEVTACYVVDPLAEELVFQRCRKLVGRHGRHTIAYQPLPQRILILGIFQRRVGVVTEAAGLLVILRGKQGILMQGLGIDWTAMSPRLNYSLDALARRGVNEIDRRAARSSQPDDSFEGKFFRQLRMHQMQVL